MILFFSLCFLSSFFSARCNINCKSLSALEAVMISDDRPEVMATEAGARRFEFSETFRTSFFKSISSTLVAPEIVKWPTIVTRECPNSPSHMQNEKYRGERGALLSHIQVLDYFQRRHSHCGFHRHLQHALIIFENDAFAAVPDAAEKTLLFARNMTTDVLFLSFCHDKSSCLHAYIFTVKGARTLFHLDLCGQSLNVQILHLAEQGNITVRAIDLNYDKKDFKSQLLHLNITPASTPSTQISDFVELYQRSIALRDKVIKEKFNGDVDTLMPWQGDYYLWDFFPPSFNCPMRERLGKMSEGGKVLCNLGALAQNDDCIVMSFGVRTDVTFEEEVMSKTKCTIYTFDPSVNSLPNGAKKMEYKKECGATKGGSMSFEKVGLAGVNSEKQNGTDFNVKTLETLMKMNKISHIDLLKIDIEGAEWEAFRQIEAAGTLEKVDQLSIELHFKQQKTNLAGKDSGVRDVFDFFKAVESAGLYAFSSEVNHYPSGFANLKPFAIEYSFVKPTSKFMTRPPALSRTKAPCAN